ncbi:MAG TPA: glutamate ABC transporter substrate-binding protein [Acidimicrobiales bacterium]|nr:glutamate ABC transporter substrate-binding protein [Acidimicrobiales bacterium]
MSWKTPRKLLAVGLGLALLTTACGDDDDSASTEDTDVESTVEAFPEGSTMARIQEQGSVKVGVKYDQPGFGLRNPTTEEIEGFDVEIAELIVEAIGEDIDIEFVESVSANREPFIQDGTVDMVVATYTINDTRKQVVDFAGPYFEAEQDLMVAADDDSITSVDDLNGKRVCSVQGSTSERNVRAAAPDAELSLFPGYSDCASELRDGRVDAVTTDNAILAGLVQDSDGAFKLLGAPFSEEPYGIGLKKGDDDFRDFINDRLEEIFESGEWAEAFEATLGAIGLETPEPPEVDRYTETPPPPSSTTTAAAG